MLPFPAATSLTAAQIGLATQAMLYVAHVDRACTEQETALIRAFYDDCVQEEAALAPFATLAQTQGAAPALDASSFADADRRVLVFSSCLMVAYADGVLSQAEKEAVFGIGRQIGLTEAQMADTLAVVQDHLLSHLSKLPDTDGVARLAQELL
jgi:uncharacterized tellurite resistance protein B-like protein